MLLLLLALGPEAEGKRPGHEGEKQVVRYSIWQQSRSSEALFRNQGKKGGCQGPSDPGWTHGTGVCLHILWAL